MKVDLKLAPHSLGGHMVEVWDGTEFIAAIYPGERAVKVISKHPMTATVEDRPRPQAIEIDIGRLQ